CRRRGRAWAVPRTSRARRPRATGPGRAMSERATWERLQVNGRVRPGWPHAPSYPAARASAARFSEANAPGADDGQWWGRGSRAVAPGSACLRVGIRAYRSPGVSSVLAPPATLDAAVRFGVGIDTSGYGTWILLSCCRVHCSTGDGLVYRRPRRVTV